MFDSLHVYMIQGLTVLFTTAIVFYNNSEDKL
jgi:hypothetical protein